MRQYVFYDVAGRITQVCRCDPDSFEGVFAPSGLSMLEIDAEPHLSFEDIKQKLVVDGELVNRRLITPILDKSSIAADGLDVLVISDLPSPCQIAFGGAVACAATTVEGGIVELTCDTPGRIWIMVLAEPEFLNWTGYVDAV